MPQLKGHCIETTKTPMPIGMLVVDLRVTEAVALEHTTSGQGSEVTMVLTGVQPTVAEPGYVCCTLVVASTDSYLDLLASNLKATTMTTTSTTEKEQWPHEGFHLMLAGQPHEGVMEATGSILLALSRQAGGAKSNDCQRNEVDQGWFLHMWRTMSRAQGGSRRRQCSRSRQAHSAHVRNRSFHHADSDEKSFLQCR